MDLFGKFRKLDSSLQRGLDNGFARVFGGEVVPAEIDEVLKQQAADSVMVDSEGSRLAPSFYTIFLSQKDVDSLLDQHPHLPEDLADRLSRFARNEGWGTNGPVEVRIIPTDELHSGQLKGSARFDAPADSEVDANPYRHSDRNEEQAQNRDHNPHDSGSSAPFVPGSAEWPEQAVKRPRRSAAQDYDAHADEEQAQEQASRRSGAQGSNDRGNESGDLQSRDQADGPNDDYRAEHTGSSAADRTGMSSSNIPAGASLADVVKVGPSNAPAGVRHPGEDSYGSPNSSHAEADHQDRSRPEPNRLEPNRNEPIEPESDSHAGTPGDFGSAEHSHISPDSHPFTDESFAEENYAGNGEGNGYDDAFEVEDDSSRSRRSTSENEEHEPHVTDSPVSDEFAHPTSYPGTTVITHSANEEPHRMQGETGEHDGESRDLTVTLVLRDGSDRNFTLHRGSNLIGRGNSVDLRIPDTGVSRQHAEIQWDGYDAVLTDLQSTNGTSVNEIPIENWLLADGDIIALGHSEIEVRFEHDGN